MKIELNRRVRRDIDAVWEAVTAADELPSWQPTLESVQTVSGRRDETGGVTEFIYDENGRVVRLRETILEAERPRRLVARYEGEQAVTEVVNVLEGKGRGETRWSIVARFRFRRLLPRLIGPFLRAAIRRRIDADMERLQRRLERTEEHP